MRRFELSDGKSNKFWSVEQEGVELHLSWGRIGTQGQAKTKTFASDAKAEAEATKLIDSKVKKGYQEIGNKAPKKPPKKKTTTKKKTAAKKTPAKKTAAPQKKSAPAKKPTTKAPKQAQQAAAVQAGGGEAGRGVPSRRRPTTKEIAWTEETRELVLPRRGHVPGPSWLSLSAKELRPRIAKLIKKAKLKDFKAGVAFTKKTSPETAKLAQEVLDHFVEGKGKRLTLEQASVALALLWWAYDDDQDEAGGLVVGYVAATEGPAFLVEALAGMHRYGTDLEFYDGPKRYWVYPIDLAEQQYRSKWDAEEAPMEAIDHSQHVWIPARALFASLDEAGYAEARKAAVQKINKLPHGWRCAMAYAFPDEPAFAAEQAKVCVAQKDPSYWHVRSLLASIADPELACRLAGLVSHAYEEEPLYFTLVDTLGSGAAPALAVLVEQRKITEAIPALQLILTPDGMAAMAALLSKKKTQKRAMRHLLQHPEIAAQGLGPLAADPRHPHAAAARTALAAIAKEHPEAVEQSRGAAMDTRPAKADVASTKSLPAVLADPPWKKERETQVLAPITSLEPPKRPTRMSWEPGQLEAWRELRGAPFWDKELVKLTTKAQWKQAFATAGKSFKRDTRKMAAMIFRGPPDLALAAWNARTDEELARQVHRWGMDDWHFANVARHGEALLPGLLRMHLATQHKQVTIRLLAPYDDLEVARIMAGGMTAGKRLRAVAEPWLRRNPETAALALLPAAVGEKGPEQAAAVASLRYLASVGQLSALDDAAKLYQRQAGRKVKVKVALDAVVPTDPMLQFPDPLPELPDFYQPATLPRPKLKQGAGAGGGKALPDEAMEALGTMLAFTSLDPVYAGVAQVREACEPESLRDFAWALFEAWMAMGAPPEEKWAMLALGHLGDDEVARRFTPLVRAWPGESLSARAVLGLDVLAAIGTDVALMHLHGISQKVKFKSIKERATVLIRQIARRLGLTEDQLADRLVPDLGLDSSGTLELDYGPRRFTASFDEQLKPLVIDQSGKRLKSLPKPGKNDAAVARQSEAAFKALKKDARALAGQQIFRLEMAMCSKRRWTTTEFSEFLVGHPLMIHLVRRLVWGVYKKTGKLDRCFRVAEDRSLANTKDQPFELPAGAMVGIPHRLELDDGTAAGWGEVLADYALVQPFDQLGRTVFELGAKEQKGDKLTRFAGEKLPAPKLVFGLERLRWRRYGASDGGAFWGHTKAFEGAGVEAAVEYDGAVGMHYIEEKELLTLREATFTPLSPARARPLPLREVDPIVLSEVMRDLDLLVNR
jgi:predicted DNA-binding WGR domain protein